MRDSSIETDPWASNPSAENRIVQVLEDEENNFHTTFDIYLNVKANEIEESNLNEKNIFKFFSLTQLMNLQLFILIILIKQFLLIFVMLMEKLLIEKMYKVTPFY